MCFSVLWISDQWLQAISIDDSMQGLGLVCEQFNSWRDSLLTHITAICRCFRSLLLRQRLLFDVNRYVFRYVTHGFTFKCIEEFVLYLSIIKGSSVAQECFWRVIIGQSGENLYTALLWLGKLNTSGCLVGSLISAPAITILALN